MTTSRSDPATDPGSAISLLIFLQRSPLAEIDLDIDRPRDAGRSVDL